MNIKYRFSVLFIVFFSLFQSLSAQENQKYILDELLDFHSIQKEIAYLHLNKSLLLQGEQLGFSAYVLNPNGFKPSDKTTNLYVQIKDSANVVIKEKMLFIENGTGASTFDIDSTFTSGTYSISAFTNWMRNFDQQYFFQEEIQVLKSNLSNVATVQGFNSIDAQFLPESGHLIKDRLNNLGIVIKDDQGYGLANASVRILTSNNKLVGNTRLNEVGIGKITFVPNISETYKAYIDFKGKTFTEKISTPIENQGILINTKINEENVEVSLITNLETMDAIGNTPYVFTVQSSYGAITYEVNFQGAQDIVIPFSYQDLKPGINIFTLFDKDKKPVAERLFFNYENLPIAELGNAVLKERNDTLQITLPTNKFADSTFMSVSILPKNTLANNRNHNIASYILLQPYVNGSIENAAWYFKDIDTEKKIALDNLLLTQGWSSYDWRKIFNRPDEFLFNFERYVDLQAKINYRKEKDEQFLIHASSTNEPTFIQIPEGKDSFIFEGIKPVEGESLFLSRVKKNGGLIPAGLSIQFFPNHIIDFNPKTIRLTNKNTFSSVITDPYFFNFNKFGEGFEQLDEVLLEAKVDKKTIRERELNNHSWGRVDVLEDSERIMFNTLANYLAGNGFRVFESPTEFSATTSMGGEARIFIDDMPVIYDTARLYQYPLANVDYIEINRTGMGSGFIGSNGSVKIYTDYTNSNANQDYITRIQKFDFPLAYALNKKFYIPKYQNTTDEFFQQYGVIDWKSNLSSIGSKNITFEIAQPEVDFLIIIEGFTSKGELTYNEETISAE